MIHGYLSLLDAVNRVVCWIIGVMFGLATLAVLIQVGVRFVLPAIGFVVSAPWTEEMARYLVAWSVFLGVGALCRNARLIAVEFFTHILPHPYGWALRVVSVILTGFFFVCLLRTGIDWTAMSAIEASPVMRLPMSWVYASMPVGSALAILNLVGFMAASLTGVGDSRVHATEVAGD
ncbi:MAG: TRAP transporter small permease [Rhizobiales bacterium]|nr:TRAP transporter small permease [Hyphomicrobiales bacterium]